MRLAAILLTALAFLTATSQAAAAQTPDQILGQLAARQTHSWIDNATGVAAQVAWYKAGGHLNVTCGYVSEIARRLLVEQGYTARRVEVITTEPWDGFNDGHAMVEVFYQGHWQLYDVDANAKAVDAAGTPVQLAQQIKAVKQGTARWQPIASDPLYRADEPDPVLRDLAVKIFTDPDRFYRRVMGIALLPTDAAGAGGRMYYIDSSQKARLDALRPGHYVLASPATWSNLTASLPATSSTAAVPATSVVRAAHKRRGCRSLKRRYRRVHTRRAYRKWMRCRARHSS